MKTLKLPEAFLRLATGNIGNPKSEAAKSLLECIEAGGIVDIADLFSNIKNEVRAAICGYDNHEPTNEQIKNIKWNKERIIDALTLS